MTRIPLFPLPIVLLPEGLLPLHIFEPRYRRMVARCLEYDRRFGLVFHDPDRSGPFLSEPGRVGCVAEIETFELLEDGRSLIVTRGSERFRIVAGAETGTPYYEADVEPYEDVDGVAPAFLKRRRETSLELFRAVLERLPSGPDGPDGLDADADVSFRLAAALHADADWMQDFLELREEAARLDRLDHVFRAVLDAGPPSRA
ncbi:MAG: LON peptidase substrate-binding domain-containing protein [Gemmatimonadetes bacterium]|nr:LON peptidase substrate-binding domain-containing protein [Gemmatimonadota bacterium]